MPSLTGELSPLPALEGSALHIGGPRARLKPKPTTGVGSLFVWLVACAALSFATGACTDSPEPDQRKPADAGPEDLTPDSSGPEVGSDVSPSDTTLPDADVRESMPDGAPREQPDADAPPCDDLEPDDTPGTATRLGDMDPSHSARVCTGDVDWVRIVVEAGDRLVADLRFRNDDGDLDIAAYGPDLVEVARADSADDNEALEVDVHTSGSWWLQVFGYDGAEASYSLRVVRERGAGACLDDAMEDDDSPRAAVTVFAPNAHNARACPGDDDYRAIWLTAGARLNISAEFEHAAGDVDLELIGPDGELLSASRSVTDNEALGFVTRTAGLHTLRIIGFDLDTNGVDYAVRITARDNPTPAGRVSGAASFHDPFWNDATARLDYHARPLVGTLVEVIGDGAILGRGYTDGRGRFTLAYEPVPGDLYVRAVAARSGPEADLAVVDAQRRIYAVRQWGEFRSGDGTEVALHLDDGASLSAPFNALDAGAQGLEWWRNTGRDGAPVPLHFVWSEGENVECGTCYRDGDVPRTIYLYGIPNDNDALDDPVILHELGHYLQNVYSHQDSPGGSHDGSPVDPRLAWAEGWSTAFSGMVRGDPVYFDTRGDRRTVHDIETPDMDYGAFTGDSLDDPISEYLVAALLYDLWDEQDDDADTIHAGAEVVRPLVEHLGDGQLATRGTQGVDLIDYLDGALCLDVVDRAELDPRLREAALPYLARDAVCDKPDVPLTIADGVVLTRRPLDQIDIYACSGSDCVRAVQTGKLEPGAAVPLPTAARVEIVARRGTSSWAVVLGGPAPDPPQWKASLPSSAGLRTVERTTAPPPRRK